jgi:GNAT superfamily N-acetyltransferase
LKSFKIKVHDLSPTAMSTEARVTSNFFDAFFAFAAGSGGTIEQFPGVRCIRSTIPFFEFNCAFVSDKAGVRPESLERVKSFFSGQRSEWMLVVPPSVGEDFCEIPRHISRTRLVRQPEMILPKASASLRPPPSDLEICRVRDVEDLQSWARTMSIGFEMSDPNFFDRLATPQSLATEGLTFYLGSCSGKPVATSLLYKSDNIAGIHRVSTIPEFRGRGFGEAMASFAVRDGFQSGCDLASLQASSMGFPVYLKMGFRHILNYRNWVVPPECKDHPQ